MAKLYCGSFFVVVVDYCVHIKVCIAGVATGDVNGDYGSVVRPQVPQYVTLQILAILQPYPQERDTRDQCIGPDIGQLSVHFR